MWRANRTRFLRRKPNRHPPGSWFGVGVLCFPLQLPFLLRLNRRIPFKNQMLDGNDAQKMNMVPAQGWHAQIERSAHNYFLQQAAKRCDSRDLAEVARYAREPMQRPVDDDMMLCPYVTTVHWTSERASYIGFVFAIRVDRSNHHRRHHLFQLVTQGSAAQEESRNAAVQPLTIRRW